jgi:hypothetical protein
LIVVIQCAARKRKDAGFLQTREGKPVLIVADPASAPASDNCVYARPDDPSDHDGSWREVLVRYNEASKNNPLSLLPAFELYERDTYRALVKRFGIDKTYILSAGWGLISASFLTPYYDVTFTANADDWKRRRKRDTYSDLSMLPADTDEEIVFLGGKDYLPLFTRLTAPARSARTVFYNSATLPDAPDCRLLRFSTTTRTNWHYECADALVRGDLAP